MVCCIYICINLYKYTNRFRDILLYTYICIYIYTYERVRPLSSMATLPPFTASALKRDDSKTTVCGTSAYLCSASIVFDIIDIYIYRRSFLYLSTLPFISYWHFFVSFPAIWRFSIAIRSTHRWLWITELLIESKWISYAKLVLAPNFSSMLELCRNRSKFVDFKRNKINFHKSTRKI